MCSCWNRWPFLPATIKHPIMSLWPLGTKKIGTTRNRKENTGSGASVWWVMALWLFLGFHMFWVVWGKGKTLTLGLVSMSHRKEAKGGMCSAVLQWLGEIWMRAALPQEFACGEMNGLWWQLHRKSHCTHVGQVHSNWKLLATCTYLNLNPKFKKKIESNFKFSFYLHSLQVLSSHRQLVASILDCANTEYSHLQSELCNRIFYKVQVTCGILFRFLCLQNLQLIN